MGTPDYSYVSNRCTCLRIPGQHPRHRQDEHHLIEPSLELSGDDDSDQAPSPRGDNLWGIYGGTISIGPIYCEHEGVPGFRCNFPRIERRKD